MHYHAGWNLTGYLPETDPAILPNANAAQDYILEELEHVAGSAAMVADESEDAQHEHDLADDLKEELAGEDVSQGWSGDVEHVSYWIEPCPIATDYTSPCCDAEVCNIDSEHPVCAGCEEVLEAANKTREGLLQHLLDEDAHRALAHGPTVHPKDLSDEALRKWHDADHAHEAGVGPRDGHTHNG